MRNAIGQPDEEETTNPLGLMGSSVPRGSSGKLQKPRFESILYSVGCHECNLLGTRIAVWITSQATAYLPQKAEVSVLRTKDGVPIFVLMVTSVCGLSRNVVLGF